MARMIYIDGVTLRIGMRPREEAVLAAATLTLPTDRQLVILGQSGPALTALAHLLSGSLTPQSGRIVRTNRVSFIVGLATLLRPKLTCRQNVKHICEIYGHDPHEITRFVADFTGLGDGIDTLLAVLPAAWRSRFVFALGYAMPFDVYLFDQHVAPGEPGFREKCLGLYQARASRGGTILVTRDVRRARQLGNCAAILHNTQLFLYDDVAQAIADFEALPPLGHDREPGMADDPAPNPESADEI
jgi:capsular polysaccharide transport system ATP-binding protein